MANTIKTRIKLRTDLATNWSSSTVKIYKGEVALSLSASGYEMRIGDSDEGKTWAELESCNLIIPAANVTGLYDYQLVESSTVGTFVLQKKKPSEENWTDVTSVNLAFTGVYNKTTNPIALKDYVDTAVAGATTSYYEGVRQTGESDSDVISRVLTGVTGVKGGSTFVIKTLISGTSDKYERIAFTYDTTTDSANPVWRAMDGNYDWNNVYAAENITATKAVGTISIPSSGSTTFNVAGKTIKQVFEKLLAQEQYPEVTHPAVSLQLKNGSTNISSLSVEYGTSVTPAYSTSLSAGSYTYGPATGVTAQSYSVELKNGSTVVDTKTTSSGTFDSVTINKNDSYTIKSTITHNAGATPVTNLGTDATTNIDDCLGTKVAASNSQAKNKPIESGSKDKTSGAITGYVMGRFYGTIATAKATSELTSANIRSLTKNNANTTSGSWSMTVPAGAATVIFAVAGTKTLTKVLNTTVNADMTASFEANKGTMTVAGADGNASGTNASTYTVWTFTPPVPYGSSANLTITIA